MYRLLIAVPFARSLIVRSQGLESILLSEAITDLFQNTLFKNASELLSLTIFVLMLIILASLLAAQLFRGTILPSNFDSSFKDITFSDPFNSFIGMYQVLSTDQWSKIMYELASYGRSSASGIIGPISMILWFICVQCKLINSVNTRP